MLIKKSKLSKLLTNEYGLIIAWYMQKARFQHLCVQDYRHQGFNPESLSGYAEVTPRATIALLGIQFGSF